MDNKKIEIPVRLLRVLGVDRAVGYAVLGNLTALILGPITVLIIVYSMIT